MTVMSEVARVMLEHRNKFGWCTLSRKEIAELVGTTAKTVSNAIAGLHDANLIERSGQSTATIYKVLFDEPLEGRRKPNPTQWPKARVEVLLAMRARGMSRRACADALGISRNAVVGKLYRLENPNGGKAHTRRSRGMEQANGEGARARAGASKNLQARGLERLSDARQVLP